MVYPPHTGKGVENMQRPFKEITLPVSGYKVGIYTYYLRGDHVAIEKVMTDNVEFDEGKAVRVHVSYRYDMEDEAVLRAIVFAKSGEENVPVDKDFIHNLPQKDFEFLRENLPGEDKKKLTLKPSEDTSKKPRKSGE